MSDHDAQLIPAGEHILLDLRPALRSILLRPLYTLVTLVALGALASFSLDRMANAVGRGDIALYERLTSLSSLAALLGVLAAGARLLWEALFWSSCRFVLTDQRAVRSCGVISRAAADFPLRNVQHLTVTRSVRERLLGLGTVGIRTSGGAFPEMYWWMLARPQEALSAIRNAMETRPRPPQPGAAGTIAPAPPRPLVLGLVGGIGAGKSAVAEEFAKLGALVIDSDKESRAALDRPDVRDQLVEWWGSRVLGEGGRVDRGVVASIVFSDPAARARLEGVVHPLVKSTRAQLIERAAREGKTLVVVDAPLLFEAGVDRECDAVVFVDAPEDLRKARVLASRAWDPAELARREKAQLPLEEKRRRADDLVVNDAGREVLAARVRDLLQRIQRRGPRRASGQERGSKDARD